MRSINIDGTFCGLMHPQKLFEMDKRMMQLIAEAAAADDSAVSDAVAG